MLRCPTCNSTYPPGGQTFCPNDGTPLVAEPPSPYAPPPGDPYGTTPVGNPYGAPPPPPPYGAQDPNNPYAGQGYMPGYGGQPQGWPAGGPMTPVPGGGLLSVGEKREPGMVLLFTFLTCGIYAIIWYHKYATEVKDAVGRQDLSPGTDLLLTFVTCGIWGIIAFYHRYPKLIVEMQRRVGLPYNDFSNTTVLLGVLFAPAAIYIIQSELNKVWDAAGVR